MIPACAEKASNQTWGNLRFANLEELIRFIEAGGQESEAIEAFKQLKLNPDSTDFTLLLQINLKREQFKMFSFVLDSIPQPQAKETIENLTLDLIGLHKGPPLNVCKQLDCLGWNPINFNIRDQYGVTLIQKLASYGSGDALFLRSLVFRIGPERVLFSPNFDQTELSRCIDLSGSRELSQLPLNQIYYITQHGCSITIQEPFLRKVLHGVTIQDTFDYFNGLKKSATSYEDCKPKANESKSMPFSNRESNASDSKMDPIHSNRTTIFLENIDTRSASNQDMSEFPEMGLIPKPGQMKDTSQTWAHKPNITQIVQWISTGSPQNPVGANVDAFRDPVSTSFQVPNATESLRWTSSGSPQMRTAGSNVDAFRDPASVSFQTPNLIEAARRSSSGSPQTLVGSNVDAFRDPASTSFQVPDITESLRWTSSGSPHTPADSNIDAYGDLASSNFHSPYTTQAPRRASFLPSNASTNFRLDPPPAQPDKKIKKLNTAELFSLFNDLDDGIKIVRSNQDVNETSLTQRNSFPKSHVLMNLHIGPGHAIISVEDPKTGMPRVYGLYPTQSFSLNHLLGTSCKIVDDTESMLEDEAFNSQISIRSFIPSQKAKDVMDRIKEKDKNCKAGIETFSLTDNCVDFAFGAANAARWSEPMHFGQYILPSDFSRHLRLSLVFNQNPIAIQYAMLRTYGLIPTIAGNILPQNTVKAIDGPLQTIGQYRHSTVAGVLTGGVALFAMYKIAKGCWSAFQSCFNTYPRKEAQKLSIEIEKLQRSALYFERRFDRILNVLEDLYQDDQKSVDPSLIADVHSNYRDLRSQWNDLSIEIQSLEAPRNRKISNSEGKELQANVDHLLQRLQAFIPLMERLASHLPNA